MNHSERILKRLRGGDRLIFSPTANRYFWDLPGGSEPYPDRRKVERLVSLGKLESTSVYNNGVLIVTAQQRTV